jgi:hypothetical protein
MLPIDRIQDVRAGAFDGAAEMAIVAIRVIGSD